MSDNKEQSVAALNTLINLALQVANTQQAQVQNAANVLAQALELGPADEAEKEEDEGPTIVTTDWSIWNHTFTVNTLCTACYETQKRLRHSSSHTTEKP